MLWLTWIDMIWHLRNAFSRQKTFCWFVVALIGFSTRMDCLGVASIIRSLGLGEKSYECLRQYFRSHGINLGQLSLLWGKVVEKCLKGHLCQFRGKTVYLIDGIKIGKEGRRMPGVKWLYQDSQNNSKPSYIFGHSCQALHVLARAGNHFIAIPLVLRIHEGLANRRGSVVMRILDLVLSLAIKNSYIVGDAYYWSGGLSKELRKHGNHLVSRVRSTAVAYEKPRSRDGKIVAGRPKKYGKKKFLKNYFKGDAFTPAKIKLYGKEEKIEYKEKILICKNHQCPVKYVFTKIKGNRCIFASSDIKLSGLEIIELYSHRFKIEFSFKEFVHDFGGFKYRFWSKTVDKSRKKETIKRDSQVENAYHLHLQTSNHRSRGLKYFGHQAF